MLIADDSTRTHDGAGNPPSNLPGVGGMVAGRYRLTRIIGAGGMGTVYEAENVSTGRRCAIKFLSSGQGGRSRSAARFELEAQTLARLEHEHVIAVFDFGWFEEQTPFFVMEYLRGQTLRQVLEQSGPLDPQHAIDLLKQACRGMAHAHVHGIVHRDLKPDNLMLTQYAEGRAWLKILDFGVARHLDSERIQLTPTGAELGTPYYMSPEQARGETVDARADVYALGAILYEALSGQRVRAGTSYNEILFQVITQSHLPLAEALPGCPSSLSHVVEHCLSREPDERPAHAGELLSLLEQIQLEVQRAAPLEPLQSKPGIVATPAPGLLRERWTRWLWPSMGVGLAVVVVTLGSVREKTEPISQGRGAGIPAIVSVGAPCLSTENLSIEGAQVASGAELAVARTALAAVPSVPPSSPPQSTPMHRPAARSSRTPSRTAQASSVAPIKPAGATTSAKPYEPHLPFAITNPYERR